MSPRRPSTLIAALAVAVSAIATVSGPAVAQEEDHDGPVVGMPPPEDAAPGWAETWLHPDYWSSYVHDAIVDGHVNLPYPKGPGEARGLPPERARRRR